MSAVSAPPELTGAQRGVLLDIAERSIGWALESGERIARPAVVTDPALGRPGAAFVTLERFERLLGCTGTLVAQDPLASVVAHHAIRSAFADPRLPEITRADFEIMTITVSVLSPLVPLPVASIDDVVRVIRPGVDGLVLDAGDRAATFLPSVWEQLPDAGAFLAALWRKAGLVPGAWPAGTRVSRYETDAFSSGARRLPAG
jgi:AmmeMemoRadiSam system protein A